jgi:hypothetical protein
MPKVEIGRLAFRHEGDFWNAYWSPDQDSMERALLLGSIRFSLVPADSQTYTEFMYLMRMAFELVAKERLGRTPEWGDTHPAPESERSGHA